MFEQISKYKSSSSNFASGVHTNSHSTVFVPALFPYFGYERAGADYTRLSLLLHGVSITCRLD